MEATFPRYFLVLLVSAFLTACGSEGGSTFSTPGTANGSPCTSGYSSVAIKIFVENPRTAASDNALAFSSVLSSGSTSSATLSGLSGACYLQSNLFTLTTDSLFSTFITVPTAAALEYQPAHPQFQQLNAFYYAVALQNFMDSLSADLSSLGRLSIDAHCNYASNAYYSPSSKRLCLGYVTAGTKKVWAADDADVVIHEAGHGVNHTLASTSIMNSSGEAGAIDEGIADYWAETVMDDGQLSEWFLAAIGASYVRDATANHSYPSSMVYEVHDDSRVVAELLWDLRTTLGRATVDPLVKRTLQLLPATTRFKDFYQALYDASGPAFLNLAAPDRQTIVNKFTAKGIHRVDTATGLRLSTAGGATKQIYIIDDHTISAQVGGNCNGVLDQGETALVLVNLENPNAGRMGMGVATLSSAAAGIQIPSGGEIGEFFRFQANSNFTSSLPASFYNRQDAVIMASFLIKATSTGNKNLTATYKPMYADATGVSAQNPDVAVNFTLNVGSTATQSDCSSAALWP